MQNALFLLKLILAHLIGDFWLQPESWVKSKNEKKWKSPYLLLHALTHGVLSALVLIPDTFAYWYVPLVIFVTHYLIDIWKVSMTNQSLTWFLLDQALHLIVIVSLWVYSSGIYLPEFVSQYFNSPAIFAFAVAIIFLSGPSGLIIGMATERWRSSLDIDDKETLKDAGKWIGILERLLIFIFITANQFAAVGLLIAAKSILRFGDIKNPKDKNISEYFIIGTLLSYGIAIVTGILLNFLLKPTS